MTDTLSVKNLFLNVQSEVTLMMLHSISLCPVTRQDSPEKEMVLRILFILCSRGQQIEETVGKLMVEACRL